MKFSDIPQFTRPSSYRIDMPWGYMLDWYDGYASEGAGAELNPDFQRGHVWTEEQQTAYVEFRVRGGMSGRDLFFNMKGHMAKYDGPLVLVDGLQRWTAVSRFMQDELPIFGQLFSEFEGEAPVDGREWSFSVHINNLANKSDVLRWYLEMNTGGVIHTDEEIARVQKLLDEESKK